jgi:hypothetical protein
MAIQTPGIPGERVLHYEVTFTGAKETSRRLIDSTVVREPQPRVVAFGNRRGDTRPGGGGGKRECRLGIGPCIGLARGTVCIDGKGDQPEEDLVDGDLSLLTPADIDALRLRLPCDDEPKDAAPGAVKDAPTSAAKDPAPVATTDVAPKERPKEAGKR